MLCFQTFQTTDCSSSLQARLFNDALSPGFLQGSFCTRCKSQILSFVVCEMETISMCKLVCYTRSVLTEPTVADTKHPSSFKLLMDARSLLSSSLLLKISLKKAPSMKLLHAMLLHASHHRL